MRYQFFVTLTTYIQLDDATFTLLERCMKAHYDHTVNATTELGGFMYGYRNRRRLTENQADEYRNSLELKSSEHQLLMKGLEMRRYLVGSQLDELDGQLHRLWHVMVEKHAELNEGLNAGGQI